MPAVEATPLGPSRFKSLEMLAFLPNKNLKCPLSSPQQTPVAKDLAQSRFQLFSLCYLRDLLFKIWLAIFCKTDKRA
jgi:hypothetical protein